MFYSNDYRTTSAKYYTGLTETAEFARFDGEKVRRETT